MSNSKGLDQIIQRAKNQKQKDIELLLKDIKTHNKVIDQRRAKKEEMRLKAEEREKKAYENRKMYEDLQKEKLNKIKQRQKSREMNQIDQQYQKILQRQKNYNVEQVEENNDNRANAYSKLNPFSSNRRQYLDKIKDKFYSHNESLKSKNEYKLDEEKKDTEIPNEKVYVKINQEGNRDKHKTEKSIKNKKPKENENHFFEIVNDIKDENEMNAILQNERNYKNKVPEHIQKTIESQRKQKESILSKRKNEPEERLYNEYLSIKSSNRIELEETKKKSKNIIKTIYTKEDYDKKIEEMKNKLNQ